MAGKIKMSSDELAKIVVEKLVVGADAATLKKVENTAKGGGGLFNNIGKSYTTKDKKYTLMVGSPFFFFMKSKDVTFCDIENDIVYEMKPSSEWPNFYKCIQDAIAKKV